jgi:hypothetical protein
MNKESIMKGNKDSKSKKTFRKKKSSSKPYVNKPNLKSKFLS